MKQVVMEIRGRHALVMDDEGRFTRVRNRGYQVGQRLQSRQILRAAPWVRFATATAAFLLLAAGTGGAYAFFTPYTRVTLDINPSLVLSLNRFDRVIASQGYNDDGTQLLINLHLWGCTLDTATTLLVNALDEQGYLPDDTPADLVLTADCPDSDQEQQILTQMTEQVTKQTQECDNDANVESLHVTDQVREQAEQYGVSPGRMMLINRLAQAAGEDADINIDEWVDKSVQQIMKATNAYRAQSRTEQGGDNTVPDEDNEETPAPDQTPQTGKPEQTPDPNETSDPILTATPAVTPKHTPNPQNTKKAHKIDPSPTPAPQTTPAATDTEE